MKKCSCAPTSETAKRVATIMHRQHTTRWSEKEIKTFRGLCPIEESDLAALERYYRWHWPPMHGKNILRHDLATLLNNFPAECDRARAWCEAHQAKIPRKIIPLPALVQEESTPEHRAQAAADFERVMGRKPFWARTI